MLTKPHQIFIGCPFKPTIRQHYDKLKTQLEKENPLHIVLADTTAVSSTDYLLEHITTLIRESAGCIFDVTDANPNVSLEIGIAHALPTEFLITVKTRKRKKVKGEAEREVKPIISDLQGRNRIEYKTHLSLKTQLEERYLRNLTYMQRWRQFKSKHRSYVPYALKIFEEIRTSGRTLRPRAVVILEGSGIKVADFIKALTSAKLVTSRKGKGGGYYYPTR